VSLNFLNEVTMASNRPVSQDAFPTRTYITWVIGVVLTSLAAMLWFYQDRLYVYQDYFFKPQPDATIGWHLLSPEMDEQAVLAHFSSTPLKCITESRQDGSNLGNRVCYAKLSNANGLPALGVASFFQQGKLSTVLVHVPWWAHGRWIAHLEEGFGLAPKRAGVTPGATVLSVGQLILHKGKGSLASSPVVRWSLPLGELDMNRDRHIAPLEWSTVMWSPKHLAFPSSR
jgi:hypothetical protein